MQLRPPQVPLYRQPEIKTTKFRYIDNKKLRPQVPLYRQPEIKTTKFRYIDNHKLRPHNSAI